MKGRSTKAKLGSRVALIRVEAVYRDWGQRLGVQTKGNECCFSASILHISKRRPSNRHSTAILS